MQLLALRVTAAVLAAAAFALAAAGTASADRLTHRATGLVANAPSDFRAAFHRPTTSYVIFSRRRQVALRYQRIRTGSSPRLVGRAIASRAAAGVSARAAGRRGFRAVAGRRSFRAVVAGGTVVRVRRATPRAVSVMRFDRRSWSAKRRRLLGRIVRSIHGGRASRMRRGRLERMLARARARRGSAPPSGERGQPSPRGLGSDRGGRSDRDGGSGHDDRRGDSDRDDRDRNDSEGSDRPADDPDEPPTPIPSSSATGDVLYHTDFESNSFGRWYVQSLRSRVGIVSPGAFGSGHAARFEVRDGDVEPDTGSERSEISGPTFDEGQDLYIRDSFRVPSGSSIGTSWQIIHQLHENDWNRSPGLAVFLDRGPEIRIGAGDGSPTFVDDIPIEYDRWHDLVYRVKLSRDPDVGFVEAWLDGRRLEMENGQSRIYAQTIQTSSTYIKAGIYRGSDSTGTSVVEHDNITIGTTLQAAAAGP